MANLQLLNLIQSPQMLQCLLLWPGFVSLEFEPVWSDSEVPWSLLCFALEAANHLLHISCAFCFFSAQLKTIEGRFLLNYLSKLCMFQV